MTVGTWTTLTTTTGIYTACSSNSQVVNGTTVTWNGADSPALVARKKLTFRQRHALFLKDPTVLPNGKPGKVKVDVDKVGSQGLSSSIFDAAREKRIKIYDEPISGQTDYGQPHAFTKSWTTHRQTVFPWYRQDGSYAGSGTINNCGFTPAAVGNPFTADHDYKLLSRLRSKVVGSEFNLASFLGAEGYDTLRFMTNTASRLYQSMVAVRKLNFREAHKVLTQWGRYRHAPSGSTVGKRLREQEDVYRDLLESAAGKNRGQGWWSVPASTYLEWQLAAEPLLGDVVAAAEQLAHITQMPRSQRVQASVTAKVPYPEPSYYGGSVWDGSRIVRKSVVAYFVHTPEPLNFLGLADPEVTLWNAFPLSFVADYAFNIGGFLEARAASKSLPSGVFVTTVKNDLRLTACQGRKWHGNWSSSIAADHRRYQNFRSGSLVRTVSASLDVPPPNVTPLGAFKSWQRAATVVSLITAFSDRHASTWTRTWGDLKSQPYTD